ncbi:MAG: 3-hexulose-6-phosphate synthase [uncultured bacterium]|jgi:3-keto-L-gulonate-6-phosphate decarboxylase|nr:MAG: 3-hexulose-6-phosphate synthase [uncultured bacterium]KKP27955.1 MAG: 3-hexulose-6-phosphate synthase [candidate division TM6 bacterium GW2011_GWF2_30_66]
MKIQISFDLNDLKSSIEIAKKVEKYCDIIEVGTILIHKYGIKAVTEFTKNFPDKIILADTKIVDRGQEITSIYSKTGVKWITVLSGTSNEVIHRVCSEAEKSGILVMLDTVDSTSPGQSALEAKDLGINAILYHKTHDQNLESNQSLEFLDELDLLKGNSDLPIFISACVHRDNTNKIIAAKPYGIIIGSAITEAKDPATEAKFYYDLCKEVK